MVLFGERLEQLKQAGWEQHYLDYNKLKLLIDGLELDSSAGDAVDPEKTPFALCIAAEMKKVDGAREPSVSPEMHQPPLLVRHLHTP